MTTRPPKFHPERIPERDSLDSGGADIPRQARQIMDGCGFFWDFYGESKAVTGTERAGAPRWRAEPGVIPDFTNRTVGLKTQVNPTGRSAGFTLLEMVIVLGIVSVVTALSMAAYDAVGRRGALQSAAFDMQGVLSAARAKAMSRGFPVWVILYPTAGRAGMTDGQGAFMQVEDAAGAHVALPEGLFNLPMEVRRTVTALYYLEDYSKYVRFSALTPGLVGAYREPFAGMTVQTCSFCSGGTPRGAVGFYPDGSAHFVGGDGLYVTNPLKQSLTLSNQDQRMQYLFAIAGPSGYLASFSP